MVAEHDGPWAALGNRARRRALRLPGAAGRGRGRGRQRDAVRVARAAPARRPGAPGRPRPPQRARGRPRSCSGASAPRRRAGSCGCLSEFADRGRQPDADRVAAAQAGARPLHVLRRPRGPGHRAARRRGARGLRAHVEVLRVLGSFPPPDRSRDRRRRLTRPMRRRVAIGTLRASAMATSVPAPAWSAPLPEHQRRGREVGRVLVLNATYEPINVCTVRRAVVLLLKDKAEVIEHGELGAALRDAARSPGRS